jgi:hypothetical protein
MNENAKLFEDIWYTFIVPVICFFSLATNLLNIFILSKLKSKNKIYKYMYYKSIINSIYLFILIFVFLIKCGQFCTIRESYIAKIYYLYMFYYLTNCLSLIDLLIELTISLNRYLVITNRQYVNQLKTNRLFSCLIIFSLLFYLPNLIFFRLKNFELNNNSNYSNQNETIIDVKYRFAYNSVQVIECVGVMLRGILMVLLIILVLLCFRNLNKNVNDLMLIRNARNNVNG